MTSLGAPRAGRPTDGNLGAAQRRNQKARDDRRENSGLRFDAGGNGESHRQRQRDDADSQPGREVGKKSARRIIFQRIHQLRSK